MTGDRLSVLLVGCGHMGTALARAFLASRSEIDLTVIEPDVDGARSRLSAFGAASIVPNAQVLERGVYDVAILAVRPQDASAALAQTTAQLPDTLVVSIVAGISLSVLSRASARGVRLVRAMPNLPATVQQAMTVAFAPTLGVSASDRVSIEKVFSTVGIFRWLETEDALDVATGVAGSGPAYVFAFAEQLQKAGEALGLSTQEAAVLARQTVIGAARVLETDPRSAQELKALVATKGGTTAAGLAELEISTALPQALAKATAAATLRARQISLEYL